MSSLYYLRDNDLIELLGDYVMKAYLHKKKKDLEESRKYHENNFQDCIDVNKLNHYLISDVITDLKNNHSFNYPHNCITWSIILSRNPFYNVLSVYSWVPLPVSERIKLYNESVELYKENTKLQRCSTKFN